MTDATKPDDERDDEKEDAGEKDGGDDGPIVEDPDPHLRAWIRTITPLLNELRGSLDDIKSGRVQFAVECTQIAALERLKRILASDLPGEE